MEPRIGPTSPVQSWPKDQPLLAELADRAENTADRLAAGVRVMTETAARSGLRSVFGDALLLASTGDAARRIAEGLQRLPGSALRPAAIPGLAAGGAFLDALSGGSYMLRTFAAERSRGSKLYLKTLLQAVISAGQTAAAVTVGKAAAGLTFAASAAGLAALGAAGTGAMLLSGAAAVAAGVGAAYGIGGLASFIRSDLAKHL